MGNTYNNVPVTITDQITSSLADKNAHLHKPGFENFLCPVKLMKPQAALPCDVKLKAGRARFRSIL